MADSPDCLGVWLSNDPADLRAVDPAMSYWIYAYTEDECKPIKLFGDKGLDKGVPPLPLPYRGVDSLAILPRGPSDVNPR